MRKSASLDRSERAGEGGGGVGEGLLQSGAHQLHREQLRLPRLQHGELVRGRKLLLAGGKKTRVPSMIRN